MSTAVEEDLDLDLSDLDLLDPPKKTHAFCPRCREAVNPRILDKFPALCGELVLLRSMPKRKHLDPDKICPECFPIMLTQCPKCGYPKG